MYIAVQKASSSGVKHNFIMVLSVNVGVCFTVPPVGAFRVHMDAVEPGKLIAASGEIVINQGRRAVMLTVSNRADRPIQVHASTNQCSSLSSV